MADTLETLFLLVGLTAVMVAAVLLMVNMVKENTLKADITMELHNINHIRHMTKFGVELEVETMYIIPKQRNLWEKLTRRVGVWAWQSDFFDGDKRQCKFYKPISMSAYFYMQLKGWTETPDKEVAQQAMDYMQWDRELP